MLGAVLKGTAKAIGGGARRIATDKLLNRKKKTDNRRAAAQNAIGEEQGAEVKGGALAVIPKASLVPSPGGDIVKHSGDEQQSGGEDLQGLVLHIKTSVISVESLLGNSVALQKKQLDDERKAREAAQQAAAEKDLEKKKPKGIKLKGPKIKMPGKGILGSIMDFFANILFGWIALRLVDLAPQIAKILPAIGAVADFIIDFGGKILNALATMIDWGYKLVELGRGAVKGVFGEEGAAKFDTFMGNIRDLIQGFLIWKIIGKKIFKAIVGNIKNAFNVIKGIFTKAGKILNWMTGGRAGNLAKNVLGKGANLAKNVGGKLLNVGKNLIGKGGQKALGGAAKGAKSIMKKGVGKAAKRAVIKMFGKTAGKIFGKIPIIGPVIVGIVSLLSGEPIGQAIFKTMGAAVGGLLGTFIPIPVVGTLLGEAIGVFVGDLLYHLIVKRDPKAAFKMLKDTVMGIFKGGKAIFNWVAGGFARFYEGIPKIKIPDFPKDPPGVMSKVPFAGRVWKGLKIALKVMMGPLSLLMGREIPNLLWLYNPMNTGPLLFKSFFPPGGEDDGSSSSSTLATVSSDSSSSGDSAEDLKAKEKARKEEEKARKKEEAAKKRAEMKAKIGKTISNVKDKVGGFFKNIGQGIKNRSSNIAQSRKSRSSMSNKISSVSKKASYEKHHHQIVEVPVVVKTGGANQTQSTQLVGASTGGGGDDPYEVLDFQG